MEPSANNLAKEAEAHLILSRLLVRKRPLSQQEELRKILQSNQSTADKVTAIKWLDAKEKGSKKKTVPRTARRPFRVQLPLSLTELKRSIKLAQSRVGFWRYVFFERRRIEEFGKRKHILVSSLLFATLRLDPQLANQLGEELQRTVIKLIPILEVILDRGWRHLSKRHYNLILVFARLCQVIVVSNLKFFQLKDKELLQKLRTLETLFFFLYGHSGCPELLIEVIGRALSAQTDFSTEEVDSALVLAKRIIYRDYELPSLFNFLVVLNMLKCRRLLAEQELIAGNLDSKLDVSDFAVNEVVREEITLYVDDLRDKIAELARVKRSAERLRSYVQLDSADRPKLTGLREFYEQATGELEGSSFTEDRTNMVRFFPRFLRLFDTTFVPLLTGKVVLATSGVAVIFAPSFFGADMQLLRNLSAKLDRLLSHIPSFPYHKYLQTKAGAKVAIPIEVEIVRQIEEGIAVFLSVAQRLDQIIGRLQEPPPGSGKPQPVESVVLRENGTIPTYVEAGLAARHILNGKTVKEALRYAILVCYQVSAYLHDETLITELTQRDVIRRQLDDLLATLKRLADVQTYDSVVQQLSFDPVGRTEPAVLSPEPTS